MGRGFPPPSRLRSLGERHKLPQRGPGRSPGRNWIECKLNEKETIWWHVLQRIFTLSNDPSIVAPMAGNWWKNFLSSHGRGFNPQQPPHRYATVYCTYTRPSYVAYRMTPVLVTLNDLEGHSPVAGLYVQSVEHLCSILPVFNWQRARAVPQRQLGFLLVLRIICINYWNKSAKLSSSLQLTTVAYVQHMFTM